LGKWVVVDRMGRGIQNSTTSRVASGKKRGDTKPGEKKINKKVIIKVECRGKKMSLGGKERQILRVRWN